MTSILIVDDHPIVRQGLRSLLSNYPEFDVVGEAAAVDEGLAYERTRPDMSSSADRPGGVHHHVGTACVVCGDTIRAVRYSSYEVDYCPTCQTGGKLLADNTTSKFLR